jgi:hypothetical protein
VALIEIVNLVLRGTPIRRNYTIASSEESFKRILRSKFFSDVDESIFGCSSAKFIGYFRGNNREEFSIRPNSSVFRRESVHNAIWIHGKIVPSDASSILLVVTYSRTEQVKYVQWFIHGLLVIFFLASSFALIEHWNYVNFIMSLVNLLFFYSVMLVILIAQAKGQIDYFKKHLLEADF